MDTITLYKKDSVGKIRVRSIYAEARVQLCPNGGPTRLVADIITQAGTSKEKRFTGQSYLFNYGLPHFFFHTTAAYAVLRHNGVEVGKKDYLGTY